MKIIGLTGPIGAGKDAVAKVLRKCGAYIIDADRVAHGLYAFQSPAWHEIVKVFGSRILMRGGKINRKKLGEIVFADKKKLQLLDKIIHPHLKEAILKILDDQKTESSKQIIVINAAVLKEIGLVDYVDEVWVVMASKEISVRRLVKLGLSKQEALRRINSQMPQKDYFKIADIVIKNEGTIKQLNAKVQTCLERTRCPHPR